MSLLKRVLDKSLRATKSLLKGKKEIELIPNSAHLKNVTGLVNGIAKPFQLTQGENLNFMIKEKAEILLQCEKEFARDIPSYKLRDLKTIQDTIIYFATPIRKVYVSGLPNLEENITAKSGIPNIKIYEESAPPNPNNAKKSHLRIY